MIDFARITADIAASIKAHDKATTWTEERDVWLGDQFGNVIAANARYAHSVYWHASETVDREACTAVLATTDVLYQENAAYASNPPRITVGKPPRSDILMVKGLAATLDANQAQGNTSQLDQYLAAIGNPSLFNIIDLRVTALASGGNSVQVNGGGYQKLSAPGVYQRYNGTSYSLATPIAALAATYHQLAVLYLDVETATVGTALTAPSVATGVLPSRADLTSLAGLPRFMARQKPLSVVYLYSGQVSIASADIITGLDPRFLRNEQPGVTQAITYNGLILTYNGKVLYY